MSAGEVVLLIIIVVVVFAVIAAALDDGPTSRTRAELQRLDDHYRAAAARQDADLSDFLTELHRQNHETYRRIKEAARKA